MSPQIKAQLVDTIDFVFNSDPFFYFETLEVLNSGEEAGNDLMLQVESETPFFEQIS